MNVNQVHIHTTFLLSNNFQKFDLDKRSFLLNGDLDMAFIAPGGKIEILRVGIPSRYVPTLLVGRPTT